MSAKTTQTKLCPQCNAEKSTDDFDFRSNNPRYLRSYCKPCESERYKKWRKANPDVVKKAQRRSDLRLRHGISLEKYDQLSESQHGRCAICGEPPTKRPLAVDHDHETDQIRGLLCDECNKGLGCFRDNTVLMETAIEYLRETRTITRDLPDAQRTR